MGLLRFIVPNKSASGEEIFRRLKPIAEKLEILFSDIAASEERLKFLANLGTDPSLALRNPSRNCPSRRSRRGLST
jgi:hypothetical protein